MSAPTSPYTCEQIAAIERVAAFIDSLCACVMAELCPRTWIGAMFGRWVSRPLADRLCATLLGLRDRMREIAAEGMAKGWQTTDPESWAPFAVGRKGAAPCAGAGAAGEVAHDAALMRPTLSAPLARRGECSHGVAAPCADNGAAGEVAHGAALMRPTLSAPLARRGECSHGLAARCAEGGAAGERARVFACRDGPTSYFFRRPDARQFFTTILLRIGNKNPAA